MKTTLLLEIFAGHGITFTVEGATLYAEPSARLEDSDRAAIRANKPALIVLVRLRNYELFTRTNKIDHRHALYLRQLHAYAQHITGEWLRLDGTVWRRADYQPDAARDEAERLLEAREIDLEQFDYLMSCAERAESPQEAMIAAA